VTVFVDTSAMYALLDRNDKNHAPAAKAFTGPLEHDFLVTHNYVVVESAALVQRRLGPAALRSLFDDLLPAVELTWIDEHLHRAASAALIAGEKSSVSLVDWTSFEVMRDHGIHRVFAFDDDFAQRGFELVP
jgi:predicted nucleic acid-binding protein